MFHDRHFEYNNIFILLLHGELGKISNQQCICAFTVCSLYIYIVILFNFFDQELSVVINRFSEAPRELVTTVREIDTTFRVDIKIIDKLDFSNQRRQSDTFHVLWLMSKKRSITILQLLWRCGHSIFNQSIIAIFSMNF